MAEQLIWEAEVVDKATAALNKIAKASEAATKALDGVDEAASDVSETSTKGAASTGKLGGAMTMGTAAAGAFAVGVAAAAAAVAGLWALGVKLTDAFREQEEVERQLILSLEGTGQATEKITQGYTDLISVANQLAITTRSGDEANIKALSTIQAATREVLNREQAERALSTALGISANQGKSVEEAAKLYGSALKGEIEPLKAVLDLSKDQIAQMGRLKDGNERAALAVKLLEERYKGLGEETQTFFGAQKNLMDAIGDTQQAFGRVIAESGAFTPVIELATEALWGLQGAADDNSEAWGQWLRDGVVKVFEATLKFLNLLQQGSPVLAGVITYITTMANAWRIHLNVITIVGQAVTGLVSKVLGGIIGIFEPVRKLAVELAHFIDADLGKAFENAKGFIDDAGKALNDFGDARFDGVSTDIDDIADSIGNIVDGIKNLPDLDGQISTQLQGVIANISSKTEALRNVQKNIKAIDNASGGRGRESADAGGARAASKELEDIRWRNALARVDILLTKNSNELIELRLQKQRAVLELSERISKGEVTQLEIQARRLQIEQDYEVGLKSLQTERLRAREEQERKLHEMQMQRLDASLQKQTEVFAHIADVAAQIGGTTGPALSTLAGRVDTITASFRRMRAEGASAAQALASSMSSGGGAAAQFLEQMGVGYEKLAVTRAIFEGAAGWASLAAYDFLAAGRHFAAAAAFGGMALGGSGGGAAAGGGGAQAETRPTVGPSMDDLYATQRRAYVDAMRETQGAAAQSSTYIISNNNFLEGNKAAIRDVQAMLASSDRLRLA